MPTAHTFRTKAQQLKMSQKEHVQSILIKEVTVCLSISLFIYARPNHKAILILTLSISFPYTVILLSLTKIPVIWCASWVTGSFGVTYWLKICWLDSMAAIWVKWGILPAWTAMKIRHMTNLHPIQQKYKRRGNASKPGFHTTPFPILANSDLDPLDPKMNSHLCLDICFNSDTYLPKSSKYLLLCYFPFAFVCTQTNTCSCTKYMIVLVILFSWIH